MKADNLRNFALICFVILALAASCTVSVGRAAAPVQAPYLNDCTNGICTVYWPMVPGYDSGYLKVFNVCTREPGTLYLIWQANHSPERGEYKTDVRQLFTMGPCLYLVTDGFLGYQEIYITPSAQIFTFTMWRSWLAGVVR